MKADKSVCFLLVFGPNLFWGECCEADDYLHQWLITLIKHLLASDFINHTQSTFPFLTLTLNNGRPRWVWPRGWESEPWVTDPCSILIHHAAWGPSVSVWGGARRREIEREQPDAFLIAHTSSLCEGVSLQVQYTHTHTHTHTNTHTQDTGHSTFWLKAEHMCCRAFRCHLPQSRRWSTSSYLCIQFALALIGVLDEANGPLLGDRVTLDVKRGRVFTWAVPRHAQLAPQCANSPGVGQPVSVICEW